MRSSMARHLGALAEAPPALQIAAGVTDERGRAKESPPHPELAARDYVSYLLAVDAEIEHSLMVQYLYAAYSLGGRQVPPDHQDRVRGWQEVVLGIAKEEMGHLMSVQNVLRLLGAPLNFGREDYPWDSPFYPYKFKLEPLTLDALAKYIYAESPEKWDHPLKKEIEGRLPKTKTPPHRVAALFRELIGRVEMPDFLPDEVFQADTWPFQAKWDEWGRGYKGGARGNAGRHSRAGTPDLIVLPAASRDDALRSLKLIAEQGEACPSDNPDSPSHFARFLQLYEEMKKLQEEERWVPWRDVAVNPYIPLPGETPGATEQTEHGDTPDAGNEARRDPIIDEKAQQWGHLFNIRYRMALTYLAHSFEVGGGLIQDNPSTPRGTIINASFGEMYNMRAIAGIMVQTPRGGPSSSASKFAGPPFLMPYTLNRPMGEANRWRQHKDLLLASQTLVARLLQANDALHQHYLQSLAEADTRLLESIDRILTGYTHRAPTRE